jgi:8-oxo-dGTP pyrophosphatase MutT (NUDIX family)
MGECKAAGIIPTYRHHDTGIMWVAVVEKKGRIEILGGKVEPCDQQDAWSTAARETEEETNHVWTTIKELTLSPHMITGLYYLPNAKYTVFVLQVTRAHFDTPSDAFGDREVGGTCAARACKRAGPFPPFTPQVMLSAARAALKPE